MRLVANSTQVACAVLLAISAVPSHAQEGESGRARTLLSSELRDSLRRVLVRAVADSAFPGAFAVVGDSRGVLAEFGAGRLDWRPSPQPSERTIWDLASLTKIIATTTALAQLVDRRQVELDAPVQRYVPDWVGVNLESVTVRHLLTHTSGLPSFRPYDTLTHHPDSLAMLLFATPLERRPGERMVYSDIGAFMMGRIVERVSGLPLDRFVAQNISGPLHMRETMFKPPKTLLARIAPTEFDTLRGGLVRGIVHDERAYYLRGVAAHAGLFSTGRDLARFAMMMLRKGTLDGAQVLRPETVALFTAYADSTFSNRGLGWQKPETAEMPYKTPASAWAGQFMSSRAYGHTGFTGTSIAIDPALDLYIILLSNRVNPTRNNPRISEVRRGLADAVVSAVRRRRGLTMNAELRK
ncbi:MAG: serine hydrolase domain-containing protein [Gemmatimonadaceae bacterium]